MSKHLENELKSLRVKLTLMSSKVEEMVTDAISSIESVDVKKAQEVIDKDKEIDETEVEIEEECLKILALHQPVAIDLRVIIGILKVNNDLERIGDLALNIAYRTIDLSKLDKEDTTNNPFNFAKMGEKTYSMLQRSINSLINMDTQQARQVCIDDEQVNAINNHMYDLFYSHSQKNPKDIRALTQYLSVSKNLERIADYSTNIAEDVIYIVEGDIVRHKT